MSPTPIRFEDFTLDVAVRELRRGREPVALEPQIFDLLVYVIRNRVVSKDDLIEAVWGGRIVSDSTLTTRINAMRRVLGDSGEEQRLIRTVARKGIRFVGVVKEGEAAAPAAPVVETPSTERPALPLPDKPSIAVLAFQNMSGDPEQEYFSDGISEDIISALSRLRGFFVIARNSSFTYKGKPVDVKQIGRELGIRYLVEGSVRKSGSRVRITAQLIDTTNAAHLWAERYDRDLTDIFAVQDEITDGVVASIEPELYAAESLRSRSKAPANLDAWDLVMRAMWHIAHYTAEDLRAAHEFLEQAIEQDPRYARALALLAWTKGRLAFNGWGGEPRVVYPVAMDMAKKAVALDYDDPWTHMVLGWVGVYLRRQDESVAALLKAIDLNPNFALGHASLGWALAASANPEDAIRHLDRAMRISPRDTQKHVFFSFYAIAHMCAGRYQEAADWSLKAAQERPGMSVAVVFPFPGQGMVAIALRKGLVAGKHLHRFRQVVIEGLAVLAFLLTLVVALEGGGASNRPHSGQPAGPSRCRPSPSRRAGPPAWPRWSRHWAQEARREVASLWQCAPS